MVAQPLATAGNCRGSATGGERSFASTRPGGRVAPKAVIPCPRVRDQRNAGMTFEANSSRCVCAHRGGSPGGSVHDPQLTTPIRCFSSFDTSRNHRRHAGVVGQSRDHASRPDRRGILRGRPAAPRRLRSPRSRNGRSRSMGSSPSVQRIVGSPCSATRSDAVYGPSGQEMSRLVFATPPARSLRLIVTIRSFEHLRRRPPRQLMRETGRRLAEAYLKDPPLMWGR
jgi:hypothetical protein